MKRKIYRQDRQNTEIVSGVARILVKKERGRIFVVLYRLFGWLTLPL